MTATQGGQHDPADAQARWDDRGGDGHRHAVTAGAPAVAGIIASYAKNADKVDGYHANQLSRVTSNFTTGPLGGNGTLVTASITAPKAGFIVIEAHTDSFIYSGAADVFTCQITVNGLAVGPSLPFAEVSNGDFEENCETGTVVAVAKVSYSLGFVSAGVDDPNTLFDNSVVTGTYTRSTPGGLPPSSFSIPSGTVDKAHLRDARHAG